MVAVSHTNPITVSSDGGTLLVNGSFSVVNATGPGAATKFAVSAPSNATAGLPFTFTVTALDSNNNTVTTYNDPVHLPRRYAARRCDAYQWGGDVFGLVGHSRLRLAHGLRFVIARR